MTKKLCVFVDIYSSATVSVRGEDVAVKAPQLNGSDIGGRKLTVLLLNGGISTVHERRK